MSAKGFGERLFRARGNASKPGHKVTQEAVGKALGVSGVAVGGWEKELPIPSLEIIEKLAELLGVSFAWLATGAGTMESARPAAITIAPSATKPKGKRALPAAPPGETPAERRARLSAAKRKREGKRA